MQRGSARFVLRIVFLLQSVRRLLFGLPQARPVRSGNHVSTSFQRRRRTVHPHPRPRDDRCSWTASRSVLREGNRVTFRRPVGESRRYHAGDRRRQRCGVCGRRADWSLDRSALHVLR